MRLTLLQVKIIITTAVIAVVGGVWFYFWGPVDLNEIVNDPVRIELGDFIDAANAEYRLDEARPEFTFRTKDGRGQLFMSLIGARATTPERVERNMVRYPDVFDHVDVEYLAYENELKENIILKNEFAQQTFAYDLTEVFDSTDSFGVRNDNGVFITLFDQATKEELIMLKVPYAYDANGDFIAYHYRLDEQAKRLVLEPHRKRERDNRLSGYAYPITVDPPVEVRQFDEISVYIGQNSDHVAAAKDGDVTNIKPAGWQWGAEEKKRFVIIRVPKLTDEQRIQYTHVERDYRDHENDTMVRHPHAGAYTYSIDYTLLATDRELSIIRNPDRENPVLDITDRSIEDIIVKKDNPSISAIAPERRLARPLDENMHLVSRIARSIVEPVFAATDTKTIAVSGTCGGGACDYSSLQAWENAESGVLTDEEIGETYNNADFTAALSISGATTDATNFMHLTVASVDRHNGTAGTGVVLDGTSITGDGIYNADDYTKIQWIEVDGKNGANIDTAIHNDTGANAEIGYTIAHDIRDQAATGIIVATDDNNAEGYNNIVYNINCNSGTSADAYGIVQYSSSRPVYIYNNTVYNVITSSGGSGDAYGIMTTDNANKHVYNNIVMRTEIVNGGSGAAYDFGVGAGSPTVADYDYNFSEDTTATGIGSNSLASQSVTSTFVSVTDGSENFHLSDGSYAIEAGTNSPPSNISISDDIDADSRSYAWDMGADEFVGTIVETNNAVTSGTASNFSFTHGLTINENDVVIAIIHVNSSGQTILDDNGANSFTEGFEEQNGSESSRYGIFYRVAGASEPSAYAFDFDGVGTAEYVAMFRVFDGVNTTSVFDVTPSASTRSNSTGSTAAEAPTMTTTYDGAMGILAVFSDSTQTFSDPTTGYVAELENNTEATANYIRTFSTAGATGAASSTLSASNDWTAQQFALRPEVANAYPKITSVTDTPDPLEAGNTITFSVDWSDADAGDLTRSFVCKTDAFASTTLTCSGGLWESSTSFATTDPVSVTYATVNGDVGTHNYYTFVCDDDNYCSNSSSGTFEVTAPAPAKIYRSVGTYSNALATSTAAGITLSVSSGVATFTPGIATTTIGIGDVIEYDSDDNGSIDARAFVYGITSTTTYTVYGSSGPSDAATNTSAADTDWSWFRAYTSMSNAESGIENTSITSGIRDFDTGNKDISVITGSNEQWHFAMYADGNDTTSVTIDGWTTATTTYMRFYTPTSTSEVVRSQRHFGKWNSGYRLQVSNSYAIDNRVSYVTLDGLVIYNSRTTDADKGVLVGGALGSASSSAFILSNNVIRGASAGSSNWGFLNAQTNNGGLNILYNNIIYDWGGGSDGGGIGCRYADTHCYAYNNTFHNGQYGYRQLDTATFVAKNNIAQAADNGYDGTFVASDYNLSNLASDAPSASYRNGLATDVSFAGVDQDNFHLDPFDTLAKDQGTDLASDNAKSFEHDIDSNPRLGTWDIGADETRVIPMQVKGGVQIKGGVNLK
ncbi:MAG: hypothetical protein ACPGO5_02500 [Patescibacteria group bacterium]